MRQLPSTNIHKNMHKCAVGESNEIVHNKKKTVTAWNYNTYWVRNHIVPNPANSKLKKLKKYKMGW